VRSNCRKTLSTTSSTRASRCCGRGSTSTPTGRLGRCKTTSNGSTRTCSSVRGRRCCPSYAAAGWAPPEEYPEEEDFIAVELAFLRYLIERQREGDEETVGYERVFIEQHLSEWVVDFADEMREEADEGLFLAAALICEGLVRFEDEIVAQIG